MPDISMCKNEDCKDKDSCYRYTAKPDPYWQSYILIEGEKDKDTCEEYRKGRGTK